MGVGGGIISPPPEEGVPEEVKYDFPFPVFLFVLVLVFLLLVFPLSARGWVLMASVVRSSLRHSFSSAPEGTRLLLESTAKPLTVDFSR